MPCLSQLEPRTLSTMLFRISTVPVLLLILSQAGLTVAASPSCAGGVARCCQEVSKTMYRRIICLLGRKRTYHHLGGLMRRGAIASQSPAVATTQHLAVTSHPW
jgi:hypothetical protein